MKKCIISITLISSYLYNLYINHKINETRRILNSFDNNLKCKDRKNFIPNKNFDKFPKIISYISYIPNIQFKYPITYLTNTNINNSIIITEINNDKILYIELVSKDILKYIHYNSKLFSHNKTENINIAKYNIKNHNISKLQQYFIKNIDKLKYHNIILSTSVITLSILIFLQ